MSTKIDPGMKCLGCGAVLDGVTCMSSEGALFPEGDKEPMPESGDITLCAHCGEICKFTDELNMQPLTPDELTDIRNDNMEIYDQLIKAQMYFKGELPPQPPVDYRRRWDDV